ncbi:hypothetical protein FA15DRAFT_660751 [Coprinopsis marcescibilis]|uniref:Protein kinase domain-containing protein n=1 Tax=Coprinopsis marcescibilis TaxID=230819 RepID=A0A5C3KE31_COPMA|nr:hypothetical protein FA15DRAFT_660751 [Coprinopsis marcescibilis]
MPTTNPSDLSPLPLKAPAFSSVPETPPSRGIFSIEAAIEVGVKYLVAHHPILMGKYEKALSSQPSGAVLDAMQNREVLLELDDKIWDRAELLGRDLDLDKVYNEEEWKGITTTPLRYFKAFQKELDPDAYLRGPIDDGTEYTLTSFHKKFFEAIVFPFVTALTLVEFKDQGDLPKELLEVISRLQVQHNPPPHPDKTCGDVVTCYGTRSLTFYLTYAEGKAMNYFLNGGSTALEASAQARDVLVSTGRDVTFKVRQKEGEQVTVRRSSRSGTSATPVGLRSKSSKSKGESTAARIAAQVFEGLLSKGVGEVMLTSVYGACHIATLDATERSKPIMKFTKNLAPEGYMEAATREDLRNTPETYRNFSRDSFLLAIKGMAHLKEHWREWVAEAQAADLRADTGLPKKKTRLKSSAAPVRISWATRLELFLTDTVEIAGRLLKLDRGSRPDQNLPRSTFWRKKTLFEVNNFFEGDETVVYFDCSRGLVFKRFLLEEEFRRELSIYKILQGVDFIPSILGTVSEPEWWGILMTSEGYSITVDDVEDPAVLMFLNRCLTILHDRKVHHHDIASRNILQKSYGGLVLIDFASGNFDAECRAMELGDGDICKDKEIMDFTSHSDTPTSHICSLM